MASPSKLAELSASTSNSRQMSMLPAPQTAGLKRKTLAERAGELPRLAPGSRIAPPPLKGVSICADPRSIPHSHSTISRPASATASHTGLSSLHGHKYGLSHVPPSHTYRPLASISSLSNSRSKNPSARPASSIDGITSSSRKGPMGGQSNSMNNVSFRNCSALSQRKTREFPSQYDCTNYLLDEKGVASFLGGPNPRSLRDVSLSAAMNGLSIESSRCAPSTDSDKRVASPTPSQSVAKLASSSFPFVHSPHRQSKSPRKTPSRGGGYLNKDSNIQVPGWDLGSRVENMESMYADLKASLSTTTAESNGLKESIALYKARVSELECIHNRDSQQNTALEAGIQRFKLEVSSLSTSLDDWKRKYNEEICTSRKTKDDMQRSHRNEIEDLDRRHRRELVAAIEEAEDGKRSKENAHRDEVCDLKRKLEEVLEEERRKRQEEIKTISSEGHLAQQKLESILETKERELRSLQEQIDRSKQSITQEKDLNRELRRQLSDTASVTAASENAMRSLKARIEFLESDSKSQSHAFAHLEQQTQDALKQADEAKEKLRTEETLRRKLHNQIQELKGNIRVFCRVRPLLELETYEQAHILFPDTSEDCKELEVLGPEEKSSLGKVTTKRNAFSFDHVFDHSATNHAVFEEISQLVQSALDGYNVCIFCYGQTGSGKTYTMSSEDGMVPRAVRQIYETAKSLEEKGWRYTMEGSFVEVYNENINDLLGRPEDFDNKKHEIRHDVEKCKTTVTDVTVVNLESPGQVDIALRKAMNNRSVAATKANERSSRSHSVFILRLSGENILTGERSEGTLNLVDLAGSERLSQSGATGDRLKETQSINKSLSCLGDVIGALGQGKEGAHIPYRNSKLTYLLQFSLGGNSKTLMFVMVSPFQAHLGETLTSLRFATKVHNTHIGTAKRQVRVQG